MKRRSFIEKSIVGAAGAAAPFLTGGLQWSPKKRIVTISYNVYQFQGYPKTHDTRFFLKEMKSQMSQRLAMELGMYKPNIVTLQEAPEETLVADLATRLGMNYTYFAGGYPGAVLTTFDIISSQNCPLKSLGAAGDLFSRHWGTAVLKSGDEEIVIYSAHLHPSDDTIRNREVKEMLQVMKQDMVDNKKIILQGDFNHEPIQNEYQQWEEGGLIDCFAKKGVEQQYTIKSIYPKRRVDYVYVNKALEGRLLRCRVLFEGNFRTNPMDARSVALSDHLPVLAEFS